MLSGPEIGAYDPWDLPTGWLYSLQCGRFKACTHVDIGGRGRQLMYYHAIHLVSRPLYEWISLTAWMGFGTSNFDMVTEATLRSAAEAVKK